MLFKDSEKMASLVEGLDKANRAFKEATIVKIEAMLTQATKAKVKKTQKDLVQAQMVELAGSDSVSESDIQTHLLAFAKAALSWDSCFGMFMSLAPLALV